MTDWHDSRVFIDTNILFYAIDADAGEKNVRARGIIEEIWSTRTGSLSTQVLSEWVVNLRKKLHLEWKQIKSIIQPYLTWQVVANEPSDPLEAIRIAKKHGISYWDGMIVQAAKKSHAIFLLTEDLNPGQKIEGIGLVNPLLK